jgi:beta-phosphoglucomutase family hydrolase
MAGPVIMPVMTGPTTRLGLPLAITACLFDLDGVLTRTALVHFAAWKRMFDDFLRARAERLGAPFVPFTQADYNDQVDGRPRADGVRAFLASRGITLPEGGPDDSPEADTVAGLAARKNPLFLRLIHENGVEVYPDAVEYVRAARDAGLGRAVVSSSANCKEILVAAGIDDLFVERIDGVVGRELGLRGKPAPDTFLEGARVLGVVPTQAAVFEDATAGVEAGRAGHFGFVVGVDRIGHAEDLLHHGADVVVCELTELLRSP